jgi:hypothetical protein
VRSEAIRAASNKTHKKTRPAASLSWDTLFFCLPFGAGIRLLEGAAGAGTYALIMIPMSAWWVRRPTHHTSFCRTLSEARVQKN